MIGDIKDEIVSVKDRNGDKFRAIFLMQHNIATLIKALPAHYKAGRGHAPRTVSANGRLFSCGFWIVWNNRTIYWHALDEFKRSFTLIPDEEI